MIDKRVTYTLIMLLLVSTMTTGLQPTQQYNRIVQTPFYRQNLDQDTPYQYQIQINPPEGITQIKTAIITYQLWLNPTVEFFLNVNGQNCNTPSYQVHTTYAGAGEGNIYFDCTNIINQTGTYNITLTPDDDTGAIVGWADITYQDNQNDYIGTVGTVQNVDEVSSIKRPPPHLDLMGTEYLPNDVATIFLQLRDEQGNPVIDGSCYLDIYSPLTNGTHPKYLDTAPMIHDDTDDNGLYYYDLNTPTTEGNYMLSATCSYSYQTPVWVYNPLSTQYANETRISGGTWVGDSQSLNDKSDNIYEKCTSTSGTNGCHTHFKYQFPAGDYTNENTTINLYYSGQATKPRTTKLRCINATGTNEIMFNNQLLYSGFASIDTATNVDDFVTNPLPEDCIDRTQTQPNVTISYAIDDNGIVIYHNWLSMSVLLISGNVQELKGSSEMHITNIPKEVWQHTPNRTLTDYHEPQIATHVWNQTIRTLTGNDQLWIGGTEYSPDEQTGKVVARIVDNTNTPVNNANCTLRVAHPNNTLAFQTPMPLLNGTNMGGVYIGDFTLPNQTGVHPYGVDCEVTGGASPKNYYLLDTFHIFGANRTKTAEEIWTYNNRTLTQFDFQINATATFNQTAFADLVWSYTTRTLTYIPTINATIIDSTVPRLSLG